MHSLPPCFLSIVVLAFLFSASGMAETLHLDIVPGAKTFVPRSAQSLPPVKPTPLPEAPSLSGLRFTWDVAKSHYIEMGFQKPLELPAFSRAVVRARFWAPVGCVLRKINIRLRDAEGEILQFSQDANFLQGGIQEVEWLVTPTNANGSWGIETPNKIVHMPARLHSLTIGYPEEIPTGYVWLLGMSVETVSPVSEEEREAAMVRASRPVVPEDGTAVFSKPEGWGRSDLEYRDGKIFLSNVTTNGGFSENKLFLIRWEKKPLALVFETELLEGNAALGAMFGYVDKAQTDTKKDRFTTPFVEIPAGRGRVEIPLAKTLEKAENDPLRISCFLHEIRPDAEGKRVPARFIIHSIRLVERQSAAEAVDFDLETGNPIHVLKRGEEDQLRFRFTNRGDRDGDFTFDMEYENYFGQKKTERLTASIRAGETKVLTPSWRPDSLGHWTVRARVHTPPAEISTKTRSLAYFTPSGPTPGRAENFLFGVCTHTRRWEEEDRKREMLAAALCGVKVVRMGLGWTVVEPSRGEWDWELTDAIVEGYAQMGIEPQFILSSTPRWALPEHLRNDDTLKHWQHRAENLEDWKTYVRAVAKRYQGKVRFYENWNEPDLTSFSQMTLDEYVSLQKATFEALREVDPEMIVMTGGFATLNRHPTLIYPEFQRDFLTAAKGHFDVHAFHAHGWWDSYRRQIDGKFRAIRQETGTDSVPWYSNETAMTSVFGQERRQAQNLFKKLTFAWVRGSIGYTWYDLRNDGYDPAYGEHHFGLVTNDFYPKEVYSVYNMLTTHYAGMKKVEDWSPDSHVCLYAFSNDNTILLAAWNESVYQETRQCIVKTDAKSASLIDLMGNETPAEIREGHVVLEVSPIPRTLCLRNATRAEPIGELLRANAPADLIPGRTAQIVFQFFNPLAEPTDFEIQLQPVPGLQYETAPQTVSCQGLSQAEWTIPVSVEKDFQKTSILPVVYRLKGTNWSGVAFLPLRAAFWLELEFRENAPSNPVLIHRTALTPADPGSAHRLWKGADDLKAECQIAADAEVLKVRLVVQDDVAAEGDQVRLLIRVPAGKFHEIVNQTPTRTGTQAIYTLEIPWNELGLTPEILQQEGFRMDVMVGDDDGEGMDTWLHTRRAMPEETNLEDAARYLKAW